MGWKVIDVDDRDWLARRFEQDRPRLRAAARRMLGSTADAEDAVQEAWLRLQRSDSESVENLPAWLTTVVARVCLNMLRARRSRPELDLDSRPEELLADEPDDGPEQEAVLGDSVGLALLVVLDALSPAERLAFVLHDMFDLTFPEIAPIVGRSPAATRQLASRARRRVRGSAVPEPDLGRQRAVVEAYLAAARAGDFDALLAVLDPDVVLRTDARAGASAVPTTLRGADAVARGAVASAARARHTEVALVDGSVGLVWAPAGRLTVALTFAVADGRITAIDVIGTPELLDALDVRTAPHDPA